MTGDTDAISQSTADLAPQRDFDAFLSYTHRDRPVVSGIQKGLHHIGRRLGQLRALRVFRDDTDLTASPDLWGRITDALDRSRFFIVTLSPEAAQSHWVNKEISYWLEHRGLDQLLLVTASGRLQWDETTARFDPQLSDAAPPALAEPGSLPVEPLFIDVSEDAPWDYRTPAFRDKITSLAAPIHGKPKDALASDDLREQQRFRRLRAAAIAGLAVLTVISVVAAVVAVAQRQTAIHRLHDAVVAKLNAEGASMLAGTKPGGDVRALQELLAANAIEADGVPILDAQIARFTTLKIVEVPPKPHYLAYRPDGRRIATVHDDGTVRQWDSATGAPIAVPIQPQIGQLVAAVYTADGRTIVAVGAGGLRLLNADTGASLFAKTPAVDGGLNRVAVAPSGKTIVTAGANGTLRLWDPHTGTSLASGSVFDEPTALTGVKFDRSGNLLAVSGDDGEIAVYDTHPLRLHTPIFRAERNDVGSVPGIDFSPDGHTVATAGKDVELWNADTGELKKTMRLGNSRYAGCTAVAYSPDGRRVATGRLDGPLQLWDADTGAQLGSTLSGHSGAAAGVSFSPDGTAIASVSTDGTLRMWSANVGQPMRGPDPIIAFPAFSPDGHRAAAASETAIRQWDLTTGNALPPILTGGPAEAHWFRYAAGSRLISVSSGGTVGTWDVDTGLPARPPLHLDINPFFVAISSDGSLAAAIDRNNATLTVWDVANGQRRGQPMPIDKPGVEGQAVAFSPDNRRVVAGYADGLRLWNVETSRLERAIDTKGPGSVGNVGSVAFSPDGDAVAAAGLLGVVQLWNSHTLDPLPNGTLHGHTGGVFAVNFGLNTQLITGGLDGTVRLWNATTGTPTASPQSGPDTVTGVAISPDGRITAAASADGTVLLSAGRAEPAKLCDKLTANMSHKQWNDWVSPGIDYIRVCPDLSVSPD